MRQHTILGERILNAAPALRPVARLVRSSHERWDGTGYPDRLAASEIPLGARIIAVCDAYEAMTSRPRLPPRALPRGRPQELRAERRHAVRPRRRQRIPDHNRSRRATPADDRTRTSIDAAATHIRALLHPQQAPTLTPYTLQAATDSAPRAAAQH